MRTAERGADAGGTVGRDPELAALEAGLDAEAVGLLAAAESAGPVRTGGHCIYLPDPGSELHWTVQHA